MVDMARAEACEMMGERKQALASWSDISDATLTMAE
jgi:hypothetical protein